MPSNAIDLLDKARDPKGRGIKAERLRKDWIAHGIEQLVIEAGGPLAYLKELQKTRPDIVGALIAKLLPVQIQAQVELEGASQIVLVRAPDRHALPDTMQNSIIDVDCIALPEKSTNSIQDITQGEVPTSIDMSTQKVPGDMGRGEGGSGTPT